MAKHFALVAAIALWIVFLLSVHCSAAEASANGAYYPGGIARDLMNLIAEKHGIGLENVVLSSGSNEALCAAATGWAKRGAIVAPSLTYDLHLGFASRIGAITRSAWSTSAIRTIQPASPWMATSYVISVVR